jgi:hypothetical protein
MSNKQALVAVADKLKFLARVNLLPEVIGAFFATMMTVNIWSRVTIWKTPLTIGTTLLSLSTLN